jgi:hypothetical protein
MATENAAQPDREDPPPAPASTPADAVVGTHDAALDAIVYEVHPALLPPGERGRDGTHDPYTPRVPYEFEQQPPSRHAAVELVSSAWNATFDFAALLNRPPDFVVPKTFGMSAILGIMTALAVLFGCLRWSNAWPVFYFFFGVQSLAICLVQMFFGQTPRLASIVAGAIILPAFTIAAAALENHRNATAVACLALFFVPFGALLGYLTGTCAAGVFLVMDYLEPYLQGRSPLTTPKTSSTAQSP